MLNSKLLPVQDERVRLRPLNIADAEAFVAGSEDPAVSKFGHLPELKYTPGSVRAMIERDAAPGLERGDLAVLAIAEAKSDKFAGSLVLFDVREHAAEVGFWVHPDHRGAGVAAAALSVAARFARASGLHTLTARTLPENPASQRALAAAGFTLKHRGTDTTPSGHRVELLHYARPLHGDRPAGESG